MTHMYFEWQLYYLLWLNELMQDEQSATNWQISQIYEAELAALAIGVTTGGGAVGAGAPPERGKNCLA